MTIDELEKLPPPPPPVKPSNWSQQGWEMHQKYTVSREKENIALKQGICPTCGKPIEKVEASPYTPDLFWHICSEKSEIGRHQFCRGGTF